MVVPFTEKENTEEGTSLRMIPLWTMSLIALGIQIWNLSVIMRWDLGLREDSMGWRCRFNNYQNS